MQFETPHKCFFFSRYNAGWCSIVDHLMLYVSGLAFSLQVFVNVTETETAG